ncbi:hypothetical protein ACIBAG_14810 [Streptomyces sp. NPDC051243]|uniref:hypothetical protein n=1 Tax=Streptomyces sp. NPDC051243 TaxID=3365646 RepID=UPI0037B57E63
MAWPWWPSGAETWTQIPRAPMVRLPLRSWAYAKGGHVIVLKALFYELAEAKAPHRLGDPEWLGAMVAELSSYTSWHAPKGNRLVTQTIRSIGV